MWDLTVSVPDHCLSFYFVRNPFSSFLGTRVSLEESHIFIVLFLTYFTFKSRKIIKLLSDMDLVSYCDKMTWKESFS